MLHAGSSVAHYHGLPRPACNGVMPLVSVHRVGGRCCELGRVTWWQRGRGGGSDATARQVLRTELDRVLVRGGQSAPLSSSDPVSLTLAMARSTGRDRRERRAISGRRRSSAPASSRPASRSDKLVDRDVVGFGQLAHLLMEQLRKPQADGTHVDAPYPPQELAGRRRLDATAAWAGRMMPRC